MNLSLDNKVAVVTGGASGIGAAVVKLLLSEGARVVIADQKATATPDEGANTKVHNVVGDLRDKKFCQRVVQEAVNRFSQIDILVNNAGGNDSVGLDSSPEAFVESLERNLIPAYSMTHHACEFLKASKGAIVNVSSKVSVTGQGKTSGYAAAKGGINALTREWAVALAHFGIRVNCVAPAECDTPSYQRWFERQADPLSSRRAVEKLVPLAHRLTTAEEVAAMIVFLASPVSSHTTGQIIFVDGGYTHLDRAASHDHSKWGDQ